MRTVFVAVAVFLLTAGAVGPGAAGAAARTAGQAPAVLVTLKPVHSLVAGVMAGVGEPRLLIAGAASPHTYSLRPSDARALAAADLVFWVGDGMETFLQKPLETLAGDAAVVTLSQAAGVTLLKTRAGGTWEAHDERHHDEEHHDETEAGHGEEHLGEEHHGEADAGHDEHEHGADHEEHAHHHGASNLHLWLDPDNAMAIVRAAVTALSEVDPDHAADYARNGEALIDRLAALDRELRADLTPVFQAPFVVFHDAYAYFERHYDLNAVGSITISPERTPGAQRLSEIRAKIGELGAVCVFSEPQFAPRVVRTVIEGTSARQGVLDPLGADHPAGPDAYFTLMRDLAGSLKKCLAVAS